MTTKPNQHSEFERLARTYRPALTAYFLRRARCPADAEDMVQDTLIKLANANLASVDNKNAYIFQMASNLLKDRARRGRTRFNTQDNYVTLEHTETDELDPSRILLGREQLLRVSNYLSELPELTRTLFYLFRLEGVSQADLSAAYGFSTRTIQKHVSDAMIHILGRLRREGEL